MFNAHQQRAPRQRVQRLALVCCLGMLVGHAGWSWGDAPDSLPDKSATASPTPQAATPTPAAVPTAAPIVAPTPAPESLRAIVDREKLVLPLPHARILIHKADRTLELYTGQSLVKTYHIALGTNPIGAKTQQGDGRTPEGRFYICRRNNTTSGFHVFLGLSYPALDDAAKAVNHNIISWHEYQVIGQRLASRGTPLWSTRLGGWVGIHGGSDSAFAQKRAKERGNQDWTSGCIGLTDREIEEVSAAVKVGAPVTIKP